MDDDWLEHEDAAEADAAREWRQLEQRMGAIGFKEGAEATEEEAAAAVRPVKNAKPRKAESRTAFGHPPGGTFWEAGDLFRHNLRASGGPAD